MPRMPEFMGGPQPASLARGGGAGGFAAASSGGRVPGAAMRGQEATNWCWAAVTQSVILIRRGNQMNQQAVASGHLVRNGRAHNCGSTHKTKPSGGCVSNTCQAACNAQHVLRLVLDENNCFAGTLTQGAPPTFDALKAEINNNRPVACRVAFGQGKGHFILVTGWSVDSDGHELVHVLDPLRAGHGQSVSEHVLSHGQFASRYPVSGLSGRINFSYRVQ